MRGGLDKLREAGVALLGGHTVQDTEIKFGYAVTGEIDPAGSWPTAARAPGDVLLLTKAARHRRDRDRAEVRARARRRRRRRRSQSMTTLNRGGRGRDRALRRRGARLHGHHRFRPDRPCLGDGGVERCSLEIEAGRVPLIDGARALVRGNMPGGGRTNREHFGGGVAVAAGVESDLVDLLFDPQTSGGLLLAVDPAAADAVAAALAAAGVAAARIGRAVPRAEAAIHVI